MPRVQEAIDSDMRPRISELMLKEMLESQTPPRSPKPHKTGEPNSEPKRSNASNLPFWTFYDFFFRDSSTSLPRKEPYSSRQASPTPLLASGRRLRPNPDLKTLHPPSARRDTPNCHER